MVFPVYLIGYMGAGKTTVGRLLADKLGWHFVDLDEAFHEIHGLSPADYIRTYGIEAFRKKEKYVVEDLAELPIEKVVYATGGGYPCWEDNMECLKELGTSFYLRWHPHHLAQRLALTDLNERPLLHGKNAERYSPSLCRNSWRVSPTTSRRIISLMHRPLSTRRSTALRTAALQKSCMTISKTHNF